MIGRDEDPASATKRRFVIPVLQGSFARFLVGGASTTLVSYAIYLLALNFLPYLAAYGIAYSVGIAWAYFANTLFVFRRRPSIGRALAFPLTYVVQYLAGSVLLVLLVDTLGVRKAFAPLVVVIAMLPVTYLLSRWIITSRS